MMPGFHDGGSLAGNESARTSSIARSAARRASIAGFINDPVDSYDGRDDSSDAVSIFDCGACVEHDRSLRGLPVVLTLS